METGEATKLVHFGSYLVRAVFFTLPDKVMYLKFTSDRFDFWLTKHDNAIFGYRLFCQCRMFISGYFNSPAFGSIAPSPYFQLHTNEVKRGEGSQIISLLAEEAIAVSSSRLVCLVGCLP